jgi:hypothetical protein
VKHRQPGIRRSGSALVSQRLEGASTDPTVVGVLDAKTTNGEGPQ